jgi:hypothetical protein
MAFSPTISGNNILSNGNPITIRGPISSSAYTIQQNVLAGTSINLGTSAANHFERAVAGITVSSNGLFGGSMNLVANNTTLTNSITVSSNLSFGGATTLNCFSSSISYNSNINNGTLTINNRFAPSGGSAASVLSARANVNTIYGTGHVINFDGTNVTSTQGKSASYNIFAGTFLTASVGDGDSSAINATGIIGNGLIVSGSTLPSTFSGNDTANNGQGSLFGGRFNAQDGSKSKSAETVFAIGTGTSYANRKTGFLIDSGSNTFVDGTLNVNGSTTITGSLILSSSNAIELQVIGNSVFTGSVAGNVVVMSITSNTASMDFSLGNYFELSASVSPLRIEVTNLTAGTTKTLALNAVTSSTITFSSNVLQPSGSAYTASVSSSNDILSFVAFNSSRVNVVSTLKMI